MVMAQSLFKLLKSRQPECAIDVIAPAWTEPLLARMPEVRTAHLLTLGHGQLGLGKRIALGRSLRPQHYDQAIVLPRSLKAAIVPYSAHARRRTGYLGELRWGLLNDIRPMNKRRLPRTVDRFNALALEPGETLPAVTPQPQLVAGAASEALAAVQHAPPQTPVLGLCPGAEYGPAKRWPVSYFAQVANAMLQQGWQVWLFGSHKDAEITQEINQACHGHCLDLGGRTSLAQAIDLMALTTTVVSNDSGLMHVASALGKPVIAIYGSSDPSFTPPLQPQAKILRLGLDCSPCFHRECPLGHLNCLRQLAPQQVLAAINEQGHARIGD